ncbi:sulfotransferase [Candidatus Cyanaurora vandensis]|uniref:sulfotransferase family protein n=2 Tax=Candidatus Cyanaurora vandensis TaxID=2714958 RepID=UPI00257F0596|nr:sulfotransferase [Candidatus Cyanaurora vandensis]
MIRDFVSIIGAMKSGTTSLFHYLAQHPQIAPCAQKEPHFFSLDSQWAKGWDWYESLWPQRVLPGQLALEASTGYTKYGHYGQLGNPAHQIQTSGRNFKFIYLLRNPLERIESHYEHAVDQGWTTQPFAQALMAPNSDLVGISKYAYQLAQYSQRFPAADIKVVAFEDLKRNPDQVLRELCLFLAIDPEFEFQQLAKVHNEAATRKLWAGLNQFPLLLNLSRRVPPALKKPLLRLLLQNQRRQKVQMTPQQRAFVLQQLQDDLEGLQAHGFDVSLWNLPILSKQP